MGLLCRYPGCDQSMASAYGLCREHTEDPRYEAYRSKLAPFLQAKLLDEHVRLLGTTFRLPAAFDHMLDYSTGWPAPESAGADAAIGAGELAQEAPDVKADAAWAEYDVEKLREQWRKVFLNPSELKPLNEVLCAEPRPPDEEFAAQVLSGADPAPDEGRSKGGGVLGEVLELLGDKIIPFSKGASCRAEEVEGALRRHNLRLNVSCDSVAVDLIDDGATPHVSYWSAEFKPYHLLTWLKRVGVPVHRWPQLLCGCDKEGPHRLSCSMLSGAGKNPCEEVAVEVNKVNSAQAKKDEFCKKVRTLPDYARGQLRQMLRSDMLTAANVTWMASLGYDFEEARTAGPEGGRRFRVTNDFFPVGFAPTNADKSWEVLSGAFGWVFEPSKPPADETPLGAPAAGESMKAGPAYPAKYLVEFERPGRLLTCRNCLHRSAPDGPYAPPELEWVDGPALVGCCPQCEHFSTYDVNDVSDHAPGAGKVRLLLEPSGVLDNFTGKTSQTWTLPAELMRLVNNCDRGLLAALPWDLLVAAREGRRVYNLPAWPRALTKEEVALEEAKGGWYDLGDARPEPAKSPYAAWRASTRPAPYALAASLLGMPEAERDGLLCGLHGDNFHLWADVQHALYDLRVRAEPKPEAKSEAKPVPAPDQTKYAKWRESLSGATHPLSLARSLYTVTSSDEVDELLRGLAREDRSLYAAVSVILVRMTAAMPTKELFGDFMYDTWRAMTNPSPAALAKSLAEMAPADCMLLQRELTARDRALYEEVWVVQAAAGAAEKAVDADGRAKYAKWRESMDGAKHPLSLARSLYATEAHAGAGLLKELANCDAASYRRVVGLLADMQIAEQAGERPDAYLYNRWLSATPDADMLAASLKEMAPRDCVFLMGELEARDKALCEKVWAAELRAASTKQYAKLTLPAAMVDRLSAPQADAVQPPDPGKLLVLQGTIHAVLKAIVGNVAPGSYEYPRVAADAATGEITVRIPPAGAK